MSDVSYGRHFALLLLAAIVLTLWFEPIVQSIPGPRLYAALGLFGLLHAMAWVLALPSTASWVRRIAFVGIAVALSNAVLYFPLILVPFVDLMSDEVRFFAIYASASAGGACTYWLAVRTLWLPRLQVSSLFRTVVFCVVATLVAVGIEVWRGPLSTRRDTILSVDTPTLLWWFAFSLSIFLSDRRSVGRLAFAHRPIAGFSSW